MLLWQDPDALWLGFEQGVPVRDGTFDPFAPRAPERMFAIFIDAANLKPGTFQARDGNIPKDCAIRYALLQRIDAASGKIDVIETRWNVTLRVDHITERKSRDGVTHLSLDGSVDLRFETPRATLRGAFAAHDLVRESDVGPDQPHLPVPAVSASGTPMAPPASPSAATSLPPSSTPANP